MAFNTGCAVVQVAASAQRNPKKRKDFLVYSARQDRVAHASELEELCDQRGGLAC